MQEKMKIDYLDISKIKPYKRNAKKHPKEQIDQIVKSIEQFGNNDPIAVWGDNNVIIEGHGRYLALKQMGVTGEIPVIHLDHLSEEERRVYGLVHNKLTMNSDFDFDLLEMEFNDIDPELFDMSDFGFFQDPDGRDTKDNSDDSQGYTLSDLFEFNPFSVLDGRTGKWIERKRDWHNLGIKSELGRDENLSGAPECADYVEGTCTHVAPATSIFDPVLCELMYKWFCTDNGTIYDCFAGGSVRGIVAEKLGYHYTGIDLRQEQVDANYINAEKLGVYPKWICGDSIDADNYIDDASADMIFSCPPYYDLEIYSDDPRDISNMTYDEFCVAYRKIISVACRKLKENRFAVFVVGDIRDKKGYYRDFISLTKKAFIENGLPLYNELIKIDSNGTAGMRAKNSFRNRKCVKVHQNVLVFYKGDPSKIKDIYKDVKVDESIF